MRIRITPAQRSAIECRMHGTEQVDGLVLDGDYLVIGDPAATATALNDASNAEDDWAEYSTGEGATYARRAARSLAALYARVLRLATPRRICAWCQTVMSEGTEPVTHGICPDCAARAEEQDTAGLAPAD